MAAFTGLSKIIKEGGANPTNLELSVAQTLFDFQNSTQNEDIAQVLRELYIVAAKELEVADGRRAIVIFVPYGKLRKFQSLFNILVPLLEESFGDKDVVFLAQRRILGKITKKNRRKRQKTPRSRTLTAVHDAILEDLVYPSQIIDKRIRVAVDGSRTIKCVLDLDYVQETRGKTETYSAVYNRLTGKDVVFTYPPVPASAEGDYEEEN
eukprot:TRINITY_DN9406_c0_g1_i1.p1 TRINITY_DN9406_c0_g1~~TRINITY_DN9406_c0_g1_i1.p1  ORF type:complete len:209 (-),score=63.05 TRINITY_DN9406_c0_g1_i1:55-681(-)